MLNIHRRLLLLRRAEPALSVGSYTPVEADGDVLAYYREHGDKRFLVALNLGPESQRLRLDGSGRIHLSTSLDREGEEMDGALDLRGDEGVILVFSR